MWPIFRIDGLQRDKPLSCTSLELRYSLGHMTRTRVVFDEPPDLKSKIMEHYANITIYTSSLGHE